MAMKDIIYTIKKKIGEEFEFGCSVKYRLHSDVESYSHKRQNYVSVM